MSRRIIATDLAPKAIGPYSQAVAAGGAVYLSGQIPLDPATMQLVEGDRKIGLTLREGSVARRRVLRRDELMGNSHAVDQLHVLDQQGPYNILGRLRCLKLTKNLPCCANGK